MDLLATGTYVEIAVRADDGAIAADYAGTGRTVSHATDGIASVYRVGIPGGTVVHSLPYHTVGLAENSSTRVYLTDRHPLVCFHYGRRVLAF